MGKNLKGKELGKGLYQRKDGRYEARIFVRGTGKTFSIYGTNLQNLKKKEMPTLLMFPPELQDMILEFLFQSGMKNGCLFMWCILLKATTLSNYVNGFERVREYIGYMRLIEVRPTHILDMIKGLRRRRICTYNGNTIIKCSPSAFPKGI